ncbi:hypothetical protein SAMN05444266_101231 [Chitinophaga jiangningensis]|uniref:YD repeat-containing protein n=1 Tax=Chitinophaga jiangningensis TaxID=1419482 RepID=A0A1M6VIW1_9BACT|nr:hypothetical protein [Chitinophaga jiangningensis]SHK81497.1 hypothetical protein SAMN05444266_101231 [Chitinophaga jiangningensis]
MKSLFTLLGVLSCVFLYAQTPPKLSEVIPPSPQASQMIRFGEYKVAHNTGVPEISIPLYTIKTGSLEYPIAISYHGSGIRVNDEAGNVGLGWMLTAVKSVSRIVNGLPDDGPGGMLLNPIKRQTEIDPTLDNSYIFAGAEGLLDTERDVYVFSTGTTNGKFVFKNDGTTFQIPMTLAKISSDILSLNGGFTIEDANGNKFAFRSAEYTSYDRSHFASSFMLDSIISADRRDTITFQYTREKSTFVIDRSNSAAIGPKCDLSIVNGQVQQIEKDQPGFNFYTTKQTQYQQLTLSSIHFRSGKVEFVKSATARQDNDHDYFTNMLVYSKDPLTGSYTQIKNVAFNQSYFESGGTTSNPWDKYRLKLDNVTIYGKNNTKGEVYTFGYNTMMLPLKTSYAVDLWGYYNGKTSNFSYLQREENISYKGRLYNVGDADRSFSELYLKACQLNKITYPTGGYTTFEFEPNRLLNNRTSQVPRSEKVTAFSGEQGYEKVSKQLSVPVTEDALIKVEIFTKTNTRCIVKLKNVTTGTETSITPNYPGDLERTFSTTVPTTLLAGNNYQLYAEALSPAGGTGITGSSASIEVSWSETVDVEDIAYAGGLRIRSTQNFDMDNKQAGKRVYKYGTGENNYGLAIMPAYFINNRFWKEQNHWIGLAAPEFNILCHNCIWTDRQYSSSSNYQVTLYNGSTVIYPEVTIYDYDQNMVPNGKTVYQYNTLSDKFVELPYTFSLAQTNTYWQESNLTDESHYQYKDGQFSLIHRKQYFYQPLKQDLLYNLKVSYKGTVTGCGANSSIWWFWAEYPIETGFEPLVRTREETITPAGTLTNETILTYGDATGMLLSAQQTSNSDGKINLSSFKYPLDLTLQGSLENARLQMVKQHMLSQPLQIQFFKDGLNTYSESTSFTNLGNEKIVPIKKQFSYGQSSSPIIQSFTYSSDGLLSSQSKENDVVQSYLWNYNSQYPTAKIIGANADQVAHSSFESDNKGNWSYTGLPIDDATAPTGSRCYSLFSGNISRENLDPTVSYIVSYWVKDNAPLNISGTTGTIQKGITCKGWTMFLHHVSGQSSIAITGTATIDELRLYPEQARMNTYTYLPLVGITSVCDQRNQIIHYIYDDLGQLFQETDTEGNILKQYEYRFSQQ